MMGIRTTAALVLDTYGDLTHTFDLPVSVSTTDLMAVYCTVSDKARVKLRIGKGHYPIKTLSVDYRYIATPDRIVTLDRLHELHAQFTISSWSDFVEYLKSVGE